MAYTKKKKAIKSVMIIVDGELYDEFKEITKSMKVDRDVINSRIYENGIRDFITNYKDNADLIKKEIEEAEKKLHKQLEKRIKSIQTKHGYKKQKPS